MDKSQPTVRLPIVKTQTCFEATSASSTSCQRKSCSQWVDHEPGKNCVLLTTQEGPLTLREIGGIYGLTRMRICQIEKGVYQKIRSHVK